MSAFDVVLLTEDRYFDPPEITEYIRNILLDDAILSKALEAEGLRVTRKSWSDNTFDWSSAQFALFRTTWDYFARYDKFNAWLESTSSKTTFINPLELVRWNLDKHYFIDLEKKGIHTVKTIFIDKGDKRSLSDLYKIFNEPEIIIKPAVSGTARHTYRIDASNLSTHETQFQKLIATESMLLQPFQNTIVTNGEVSMVLVDGNFTHAVLKRTKQGDFRVQDDFGGTLLEYSPTQDEILFAEAAINACPIKPMYARVDILRDNDGLLAVMELEVIEPELWFRRNPSAAGMLASAIKKLF